MKEQIFIFLASLFLWILVLSRIETFVTRGYESQDSPDREKLRRIRENSLELKGMIDIIEKKHHQEDKLG